MTEDERKEREGRGGTEKEGRAEGEGLAPKVPSE